MMPNTRSAKLARWQIWLLSLGGALLWISGSAWLLLHYYGQVEGEFGPETNPLEPWLMRAHGFLVFPTLLGIGSLLVVHIPKGWKDTRQRIAGSILSSIAFILIATGYLLYYIGDDGWRGWSSTSHWIIGLATPAAFVWHYAGRSASSRVRSKKSRGKDFSPPIIND